MSFRDERSHRGARVWLAGGAVLIVVAVILSRPWIALAYAAATYPVTRAGEAGTISPLPADSCSLSTPGLRAI